VLQDKRGNASKATKDREENEGDGEKASTEKCFYTKIAKNAKTDLEPLMNTYVHSSRIYSDLSRPQKTM
jgi:hypothetical protein